MFLITFDLFQDGATLEGNYSCTAENRGGKASAFSLLSYPGNFQPRAPQDIEYPQSAVNLYQPAFAGWNINICILKIFFTSFLCKKEKKMRQKEEKMPKKVSCQLLIKHAETDKNTLFGTFYPDMGLTAAKWDRYM